jgi:hypothetical protein
MTADVTGDVAAGSSMRISGGASPQEIEAVLAAMRAAVAAAEPSKYELWRRRRLAALAKAQQR